MAEYELSDFQKTKIQHVFKVFYDSNQDGVIEWADFDLAIQKICGIHKWAVGSDKHNAAKSTLKVIWEGLQKFADENEDGQVTEDEWLKMWTECVRAAENGTDLPDWQKKYMKFMFDVNDTSGDELIDLEEYTTVYMSYGVSRSDCEAAFNKFSDGGTQKITRCAFESLWKEYFVSKDVNSKGNYLFGQIAFDNK